MKLACTSHVPDPARPKPAAVLEGDALEADVLDGPVERASQFDQRLHRRGNRFDLGHVFARPRNVIDGLRRAVQVPLARLVQQFQRIFDVAGDVTTARRPWSARR